jgi:hypothetical protein
LCRLFNKFVRTKEYTVLITTDSFSYIKVKLSPWISTPYMYAGEMEVKLHTFLTSVPYEDNWSASCYVCLNWRNRDLVPNE